MEPSTEQSEIPHTISTQHPDNVNVPEWSNSEIIDGNVEILEAYFAYGALGCQARAKTLPITSLLHTSKARTVKHGNLLLKQLRLDSALAKTI
ncbi:MAG: phosphoenolpyruvate carboxylase [Chloroflexota bacterium]